MVVIKDSTNLITEEWSSGKRFTHIDGPLRSTEMQRG